MYSVQSMNPFLRTDFISLKKMLAAYNDVAAAHIHTRTRDKQKVVKTLSIGVVY